MDTISTFLDAMFAPYPETPRLLEAKRELRAMMEDAYADAMASGKSHNEAVGSVITDFGNLEELAPVLGILPDIRTTAKLDDDEVTNSAAHDGVAGTTAAALRGHDSTYEEPHHTVITLPDAQALAEARRSTSTLLANGVALCVLAGAVFLTFLGLAKGDNGIGVLPLNDNQAAALGLPCALVLVAVAVGLFIRRQQAFVGLEHLVDGTFTRDPIVTAWAARLRIENEGKRSRALAVAVTLWILAAIPVLAAAFLSDNDGNREYMLLAFAVALLMVATGLRIFLPTNWAAATHDTVTHQGQTAAATPPNPKELRFSDALAGPYWLLCLGIYLGGSFITQRWDLTWMIWPIAGVLFGIIAATETGIRSWKAR
ncbi:permease prefix domain 1-containing protein [Actinobaculum sp. 313]|uniref:permease prefix domain 1-containing protein n=1 Tax=Actinobaculum sp. 313 TaxID=2495645 RepID=UPI000D52A44D|nr:permease prefix domain 1-containing protein [Actinobaculum sp. 313]AWE41494.1 hypothetical protein DDD63_00485 [Actinobaculum sp. 313]